MNTLRLDHNYCYFLIFSNNVHLNNKNSWISLRIQIKRFIYKFLITTHLNNLINQKITNILWNARASYTLYTIKKDVSFLSPSMNLPSVATSVPPVLKSVASLVVGRTFSFMHLLHLSSHCGHNLIRLPLH